MLAKTTAPTYIGTVSAPSPIYLIASTCGRLAKIRRTRTGKFGSARINSLLMRIARLAVYHA